MRGAIWLILAVMLAIGSPVAAQLTMTGVGAGGFGAGGFSASCSQSANFIARLASPPLANETAYDTFICGGVTDGWWAKMDVVYLFATYSSTSALLNLVSTSFNGTPHGGFVSGGFTAGFGFTGDGSTSYIDTGDNPNTAGGVAVQNSIHFSACATQAGSGGSTNEWGAYDGTTFVEAAASATSLIAYLNLAGGALTYNASPPPAAYYVASRTTSTQQDMYKNAVNVASNTNTTTGLVNRNVYVFARNNQGTADTFNSNQLTIFTLGSGVSAADVTNMQSRVNTYMTAFSISVC